MQRDELERPRKAELIELALRLHKTSRTSSKPPSTGLKERREHAKPGGAKPAATAPTRL